MKPVRQLGKRTQITGLGTQDWTQDLEHKRTQDSGLQTQVLEHKRRSHDSYNPHGRKTMSAVTVIYSTAIQLKILQLPQYHCNDQDYQHSMKMIHSPGVCGAVSISLVRSSSQVVVSFLQCVNKLYSTPR